ncbi:MAG: hypothetical protein G01um101470_895 [Parcubacteria group bacterium Gr01-1014_70]|nr:MAG: hypothetical protein G01um101470_895 [Parcubacteria group bacterium Gr01-1014_70]
MYSMRRPALVLALAFLLFGGGVVVADTIPESSSASVAGSSPVCNGYARVITDEMMEQWKKVAPYVGGRVSKVTDVRYRDAFGIEQKIVYRTQASGRVLRGSYLLTASHVVKDIPEGFIHAWLHFKGVGAYSNLRVSPFRLEIAFDNLQIYGSDLVDTAQKPIISEEFDLAIIKLRVVFPEEYSSTLSFGSTQDILGIGKSILLTGTPSA